MISSMIHRKEITRRNLSLCFENIAKKGGGLLDEDNRNLVEIIIHATITHTPPPTTLLIHELIISFFLDMDLSVLGRDEVGYNLYSKQIRQEYIHMSPTDYASGRAGVLRSFLTRGDLMYYTTHFRGLFLDKAKMNLELELAQLEKGSV